MRLLAALVALVSLYAPVRGAEACSGLRRLENGRTFFRYGGLLVTFSCRPGYKLHGYKTSSCVSGHWSRDPPVCVGSGCFSPGALTNGTISVNEDGSWVVFSCNSGFQLRGPAMLYCKGNIWNSTKPVCKESDMMSSVSGVSLQKPNLSQNLQDATVLKTKQQSHYDTLTNTVSKGANPKVGLLSHTSSHPSTESPKVQLQHHLQLSHFKIKHGHQTTHEARLWEADEGPECGTEGPGSESEMMASKEHWSSTSSSSPAHTPSVTAVTNTYTSSSPTTSDLPVLGSSPPPSSGSPPASSALDLSSPRGTFSTSTSSRPMSTEPSMKTWLPHITTGHHNLPGNGISGPPLPSQPPGRRPVCSRPPVPTHGTFYFRSVENPGAGEFRHYVQYGCHAGYTLARGDTHSYCREGAWSGVTPVCLELTPCSVNNGGCSQRCSRGSNQTETRTRCSCTPGFTLLDDGRTCRDVDECVEGQHQCRQRCINTFGSFQCGCDAGYQPAHDQASCTDVDECLLPVAVTGCVFGCVNTPGSFYCQCPAGYSLQSAGGHCQDIDECAVGQGLGPCVEQCHNSPGSYRCSCSYGHTLTGDGRGCVAECPPGYRKRPTAPPENSTAQAPKEECVDINECQEDVCEWRCVNLPGSHRCICPRGYLLQKDGRRCKDINECSQKNGGCSHLCLNQKGSYKCACPASHRLSSYSWKKCLPRTAAVTAG